MASFSSRFSQGRGRRAINGIGGLVNGLASAFVDGPNARRNQGLALGLGSIGLGGYLYNRSRQLGRGAPAAPDYRALAQDQYAMNRRAAAETFRFRNPNVNSPLGSLRYSKGPDGTWNRNISFNPAIQSALDATQRGQVQAARAGEAALGRARARLSAPISGEYRHFGGTPLGLAALAGTPRGEALNPYGTAQNRYETAAFDRGERLLAPQLRQERADLDASLYARGVDPSSTAGQRSLGNLARRHSDQRTSLALNALEAGRVAQGQAFNQRYQNRMAALTEQGRAFDQQERLRADRLGEDIGLRNLALEEANYLQRLGAPSLPSFPGHGGAAVGAPNLLNAAQQGHRAQLDSWARGQQAQANSLAALGQFGGAALGAGWDWWRRAHYPKQRPAGAGT